MRTDKEYYADDKFIIKTIRNFASIKLSAIKKMKNGQPLLESLYMPVRVENLDAESCTEMSYADLIGLIAHSEFSPDYDRFEYTYNGYEQKLIRKNNRSFNELMIDSHDNYLYEVCLLSSWILSNQNDTTIKMFLNIPLKKFLDIQRLKLPYTDFEKLNAYYYLLNERFALLYKDVDQKNPIKDIKKRTIKDMLTTFNLASKRVWIPSVIPDELYCDKIRDIIEMEGIILIKYFQFMFSDSFDYDKVIEKYAP